MKKLLHFSLITAAALYFGACGSSSEPPVLLETGTGAGQNTGLAVQTGMEGVVEGTGVVAAVAVDAGDSDDVTDDTDDAADDSTDTSKVERGILAGADSPIYKNLFFPANNGTTGIELYQYDLEDMALKNPINIRAGGGSSNPAGMIEVDGKIYMSANDGVNGRELWIYDGTAGIARIWNVNVNPGMGSNPTFLTHLDGKIYFSADENAGTIASQGRELYYYDIAQNRHGLVTNHLLQPLNPGVGSNPTDLIVQNGALYFSADSGNGLQQELYRYDPVADKDTGPQMVANVTLWNSNPIFLADIGGKIYFSATDTGVTSGRELYVYDRNTNTTSLVRDINPGAASSNPTFLTAIDGKIFFSANDGHPAIGPNRELMMYDTTIDYMTTVADISLVFGSNPQYLTYMDGNLYFAGFRALSLDGSGGVEYTGIELWKYNLDSQNASLVDNISQGAFQDSAPFWIAEANGMLYFGAFTPLNGRELWKSDGENPSTPLGNFRVGPASFLPGAGYNWPATGIVKTTW